MNIGISNVSGISAAAVICAVPSSCPDLLVSKIIVALCPAIRPVTLIESVELTSSPKVKTPIERVGVYWKSES